MELDTIGEHSKEAGDNKKKCKVPQSDLNEEWLESHSVKLRDGKSLEDLEDLDDNAFEFHELIRCKDANEFLDMVCENGRLVVNGCKNSEGSKIKHITENELKMLQKNVTEGERLLHEEMDLHLRTEFYLYFEKLILLELGNRLLNDKNFGEDKEELISLKNYYYEKFSNEEGEVEVSSGNSDEGVEQESNFLLRLNKEKEEFKSLFNLRKIEYLIKQILDKEKRDMFMRCYLFFFGYEGKYSSLEEIIKRVKEFTELKEVGDDDEGYRKLSWIKTVLANFIESLMKYSFFTRKGEIDMNLIKEEMEKERKSVSDKFFRRSLIRFKNIINDLNRDMVKLDKNETLHQSELDQNELEKSENSYEGGTRITRKKRSNRKNKRSNRKNKRSNRKNKRSNRKSKSRKSKSRN
jgi:hypothetical protein